MASQPISDRKLAALRKNALKSTGPRTEEGKAVVAKNAMKHGILSRDLIIRTGEFQEDPDEYAALLAGIEADWEPTGVTERFLCEKIAGGIWRLRRALRYESGLIALKRGHRVQTLRRKVQTQSLVSFYSFTSIPDTTVAPEADSEKAELDEEELEQAQALGFPDEAEAQKIARYITALDKEVYRAMSALATLKQGKRSWKPCEYSRKVGRQDELKSADVEESDGT